MDNTRNGEADCPRLRQGYVAQAGCGESAPQSAQARALKKAARALEESTVIVPYGQEATAKLPPNVISLATLQSLEREIERTEPDEGSRFTQPRFSEPSIARTDDSARAPFEQRHASPGTVGIQELTRAMGVDHGLETGPTAPRATWHANPLQSMLTPRPAQHYRLQMTPGVGLQVQPVERVRTRSEARGGFFGVPIKPDLVSVPHKIDRWPEPAPKSGPPEDPDSYGPYRLGMFRRAASEAKGCGWEVRVRYTVTFEYPLVMKNFRFVTSEVVSASNIQAIISRAVAREAPEVEAAADSDGPPLSRGELQATLLANLDAGAIGSSAARAAETSCNDPCDLYTVLDGWEFDGSAIIRAGWTGPAPDGPMGHTIVRNDDGTYTVTVVAVSFVIQFRYKVYVRFVCSETPPLQPPPPPAPQPTAPAPPGDDEF